MCALLRRRSVASCLGRAAVCAWRAALGSRAAQGRRRRRLNNDRAASDARPWAPRRDAAAACRRLRFDRSWCACLFLLGRCTGSLDSSDLLLTRAHACTQALALALALAVCSFRRSVSVGSCPRRHCHTLSLLALSAVAAAATAGETSGQQIFMPGSSRSPRVETVGLPHCLPRPFLAMLVEPDSQLTVARCMSRAQGDAATAAGPAIGAIGAATAS
jgi:hypothetical protein